MSTTYDRVTFPGHAGELSGRLHRPAGKPRATALFAHCFTCSKDLRAAITIADALAEEGIAVLRFDFTGLGQSEGEFSETSFSSNVEDLVAAADYLRREHAAPSILCGHSLGGAAVLAAADRIEEAVAIATIGAPAEPSHVKKLLEPAREEIEARGEAEVTLSGRTFRIKKAFLDDLEEQSLKQKIASLRRALLVCHAPRDSIVGVDNARRIFEAAKHPKSFLSLDDADHLLRRRRDADYAARVIAAWAARYLEEEEEEEARREQERGLVRARTGGSGFVTHVVAAGHPLRADEPVSFGGTDTGPTPYDLLLAALGACTTMTLRMYADRKGWSLEAAEARLRHQKIHARDCEECETKAGKLDHIEREILLEGDLDQAQRQRLLEIANRCPVHRTLHSEVRVTSRLA